MDLIDNNLCENQENLKEKRSTNILNIQNSASVAIMT